jgi:hypothetical protein
MLRSPGYGNLFTDNNYTDKSISITRTFVLSLFHSPFGNEKAPVGKITGAFRIDKFLRSLRQAF